MRSMAQSILWAPLTIWLEAGSKSQVGPACPTPTPVPCPLPSAPCPQGQPRHSLGFTGEEVELIGGGHNQGCTSSSERPGVPSPFGLIEGSISNLLQSLQNIRQFCFVLSRL